MLYLKILTVGYINKIFGKYHMSISYTFHQTLEILFFVVLSHIRTEDWHYTICPL